MIHFSLQVTATVWGGYQAGGSGGGPGPITTTSVTPSSLGHCMPSASSSTMTQVDNNGQPGNGQLQRDKDNQQNAPLPSFAK